MKFRGALKYPKSVRDTWPETPSQKQPLPPLSGAKDIFLETTLAFKVRMTFGTSKLLNYVIVIKY